VSCDRGGVRIGIEAPSTVKILRGEIAEQVAQENQRAAAVPAGSEWLSALGAPQATAPAGLQAPSSPPHDPGASSASGAAPPA